jgi:hypothetical protein
MTSSTVAGIDLMELAGQMGPSETDFLDRVCDGRKLGLADRHEDRARQWCRRKGLAKVVMNPRRWIATPLGLAVRDALRARASLIEEERS